MSPRQFVLVYANQRLLHHIDWQGTDMEYYRLQNPKDYQLNFYRNNGFRNILQTEYEQIWQNGCAGSIHSYGILDSIQAGIGDYTISRNMLVEFDYETSYLHFGIIYEGITYSLVEDTLQPMAVPSAFLAMERACGGTNCWKKGQKFRGVEISIETRYLQNVLLPFLGCRADALDFLRENVRYTDLSKELRDLLLKAEDLLNRRKLTMGLLNSICLEFISYLFDDEIRDNLLRQKKNVPQYVQIGGRRIRMSQEDFDKVAQAHDMIARDATSFCTIYDLSKSLNISEQKLKAGFSELYQQTIWNYANNIRMNLAVSLLAQTELSIAEISFRIGYQNSTSFTNMFKNWCGLSPSQFRRQVCR